MSVRIKRITLISAMAERDMTVGQLVELSGVSRSTIAAARSGKTVSKATAERLAAVLGREVIKEG